VLLTQLNPVTQGSPLTSKQEPAAQALVPLHTGVEFVSVMLVVMLEHVPLGPTLRAAEQAWHTPPHALLQQKPSMQLPLVHWLPVPVQAAPCAFFAVHVEPTQYAVLMQSLSPVHVVRQAAPLHW
jgi:hypothetical protein